MTLPRRSLGEMMAKIDDIIELAIINDSLGPQSPYYRYTLERFRVERSKVAAVPSKTHCRAGHAYTPQSRDAKGRLRCRVCARDYSRKYDAKQKEKVA